MSKSVNLEKIKFLMAHAEANVDLCMAVYQIISTEEADKQIELFQYFVTNIMDAESDESLEIPSLVETEQIIEYSELGFFVLEDFIKSLYQKQVSESVFYEQLWEFIQKDYHFDNDVARAVAIFNCLRSMSVPYVEIDLTKALVMEQDEFEIYMDAVGKSKAYKHIAKINRCSFEQKTQRFSLLLNELEACTDYKTRVMLLIVIAMEEREEGFQAAMHTMLKKNMLSDIDK